MKLLSKKEISVAISADKAREIAEGLKISRKVDSLRELKSKEEEELERFRNESIAAITKEINSLLSKKETIEKEIFDIRQELSRETSLTRDERLNLEKLKATLKDKEGQLSKKEDELKFYEIDIAIAKRDAEDALARAQSHDEEATRLHIVASNQKIESDNTLERARKIEEESRKNADERDNAVQLKERGLLVREQNIILKEKENLNTERELAKEKLQLADQRATLERAFERLKKNRL